VLNSFGHPVPRVAGKLQRSGRAAAAKIVKAEFTDQKDTLAIDIASCYAVAELTRLTRTFEFSREGRGSLRVADEVQFASPQAFETALVTYLPWKQTAAGTLLVGEGAEAVKVTIDAGKQAFRIEPTEIKEDVPGGRLPVRLGIVLVEPVREAAVRLTITPAG